MSKSFPRRTLIKALMLGTAGLPLAALGLTWVLRRAFASLEPIRQELARRPPHDLRPLLVGDAPIELKAWLTTVNSLLARVGDLVEGERSFAATTAPQLQGYGARLTRGGTGDPQLAQGRQVQHLARVNRLPQHGQRCLDHATQVFFIATRGFGNPVDQIAQAQGLRGNNLFDRFDRQRHHIGRHGGGLGHGFRRALFRGR